MRWREAAIASLAAVLLACEAHAPAASDPSAAITPMPIDSMTLEHADGARLEVRALERPILLHFWATWCTPCRRELPVLLEAAREHDARVLAVSTDSEWAPVRAFFDGAPPPAVVRDPSGVLARALGVSSLPDTYVVDGEGRATRRIAGPLDWSTPEHRAWLASTAGGRHGSEEE